MSIRSACTEKLAPRGPFLCALVGISLLLFQTRIGYICNGFLHGPFSCVLQLLTFSCLEVAQITFNLFTFVDNLSMKPEIVFVSKVHPTGVTFILNTLMLGSYVQP